MVRVRVPLLPYEVYYDGCYDGYYGHGWVQVQVEVQGVVLRLWRILASVCDTIH